MIDTAKIRKGMLYSEYSEACSIHQQCKKEGISIPMMVAIAYKTGLMKGKNLLRERINDAHKKLHDANKRSEEIIENWISDVFDEYCQLSPEEQLADINDIRKQLDQMEEKALNRKNSTTSSDKMEDQNHG